MDETEFAPKLEQWILYTNLKNYTEMPQNIRTSYQKVLYNRNNIPFDKKNKGMLKWDDKLQEFIEKSLYKRRASGTERPSGTETQGLTKGLHQNHLENDTYLFVKHLIFIDDNEKRSLHKKIRHEIFDRSYVYNYHSDDEEFDVEDDNDY